MPAAQLSGRWAQINKMINEKEVKTDITEIQRIIKDYYKLLHANKTDNLLEKYHVPRLRKYEQTNPKYWNCNCD